MKNYRRKNKHLRWMIFVLAAAVVLTSFASNAGDGMESPIHRGVALGELVNQGVLPVSEDRMFVVDVSHGTPRTVTAYTSHVAQTDATPCIGATGGNICHLYHDDGMRICAANFVPFGTELHVGGYGECVVMDRMHSRHGQRVDIYMGYDYEAAMKWGKRTVNVIEI